MSRHGPYLHARPLDHTDLDEIAALLGRGMADNPLHIAVYGGDDAHRARRHERLMRTLLVSSPSTRIDGVEQEGSLVGAAAAAPPGRCQPGIGRRIRLVCRAATFGPAVAARLMNWSAEWGSRDLREPHVHLGPVAVDRHLRGRGIGNLLMLRHARSLDAVGLTGYLETDRPEALGFYRRYGYAIVGEQEILGVPTWFMRRLPV